MTAKIPREVCDHGAKLHKSQSKPSLIRPSPKLQTVSESIPSVQIQPIPSVNPRYPMERNPHHNLIDNLYKDNYIERFVNEKDQKQESRSEQDFDQQLLEDYLVEETEGKHFL